MRSQQSVKAMSWLLLLFLLVCVAVRSLRNPFRGPGYFNTDLNVKKSFRMTERFKSTLGANFFNVLNRPNFQNLVNNDLSSAFGQITAMPVSPTTPYGAFLAAAEGMRILQVFGKINF